MFEFIWSESLNSFVDIVFELVDGLFVVEYEDEETGEYAFSEVPISDLHFLSESEVYEGIF